MSDQQPSDDGNHSPERPSSSSRDNNQRLTAQIDPIQRLNLLGPLAQDIALEFQRLITVRRDLRYEHTEISNGMTNIELSLNRLLENLERLSDWNGEQEAHAMYTLQAPDSSVNASSLRRSRAGGFDIRSRMLSSRPRLDEDLPMVQSIDDPEESRDISRPSYRVSESFASSSRDIPSEPSREVGRDAGRETRRPFFRRMQEERRNPTSPVRLNLDESPGRPFFYPRDEPSESTYISTVPRQLHNPEGQVSMQSRRFMGGRLTTSSAPTSTPTTSNPTSSNPISSNLGPSNLASSIFLNHSDTDPTVSSEEEIMTLISSDLNNDLINYRFVYQQNQAPVQETSRRNLSSLQNNYQFTQVAEYISQLLANYYAYNVVPGLPTRPISIAHAVGIDLSRMASSTRYALQRIAAREINNNPNVGHTGTNTHMLTPPTPRRRFRSIIINPRVKGDQEQVTLTAGGQPGDPDDSDTDDDDDKPKGNSDWKPEKGDVEDVTLHTLPPEVIDMILIYLSPPSQHVSLLNVMKSCKTLYQLGWRFFYRNLGWPSIRPWVVLYNMFVTAKLLDDVPEPVLFRRVEWVIGRPTGLIELYSNRLDRETTVDLAQRIQHCIQNIDFTMLSTNGEETHIVTRIALAVPNLINLSLYRCKFIKDEFLERLADNAPRLRYLNLSYCAEITDNSIALLTENCPQLRGLILRECRALTDQSLRHLGAKSFHLRQLILAGCIEMTDVGIESLVSRSGKLTLEDEPLPVVHPGPCQLRHLVVTRLPRITDKTTDSVIRYAPFLNQLNMTGCGNVTTETVVKILRWSASQKRRGEAGLRTLNVSECTQVKPDVVQMESDAIIDDLTREGHQGVGLCSIHLSEVF